MAKFAEIIDYLEEKGIPFKVINLPETAVSVEDVIRLSNGQVRPEEIIKTLIFKTNSGEFKACIIKGKDKVNVNKLKDFNGLATKDEVIQISGVEIGAMCPILLGVHIIIDQNVTNLKRVNMGSGDHLKGLEMDLKDLLKAISNFSIEEIV